MSITIAAHSEESKAVHEKILSGSKAKSRFIRIPSAHRIHLIEAGNGPPVLLSNGSVGNQAVLPGRWNYLCRSPLVLMQIGPLTTLETVGLPMALAFPFCL